jgi:hypothetical protein
VNEFTIKFTVDDLLEHLEPWFQKIIREEIAILLETSGSEAIAVTNPPPKDVMTNKETAAYLGLSSVTIHRLRMESPIGYFRVCNRVLFSHIDHIKPFLVASGSGLRKRR